MQDTTTPETPPPARGIIHSFCQRLTSSRGFELAVIFAILGNTGLTGIDPFESVSGIAIAQRCLLGFFSLEIAIRFVARRSLKTFFTDGWNLFDIALVTLGWLPETLFVGCHQLLIFRALRVVRILRMLRISTELKLIVSVLAKSFKSLLYNAVFFLTFIYLFAILGVILFRLPDADEFAKRHHIEKGKIEEFAKFKKAHKDDMPETFADKDFARLADFDKFHAENPNADSGVDAYGNVPEAMFSLFRISTGDDWTIIPYSTRKAYKYGLIDAPPQITAVYHVVWFALSVFLLLNLLLGAVVNNYETVMEEVRSRQLEKDARRLTKD